MKRNKDGRSNKRSTEKKKSQKRKKAIEIVTKKQD
jgi:hypothetical protein